MFENPDMYIKKLEDTANEQSTHLEIRDQDIKELEEMLKDQNDYLSLSKV
tara:strand:- start:410 stop:559 length:150 start_codon:yes stop_codon:yes gene_type:complete